MPLAKPFFTVYRADDGATRAEVRLCTDSAAYLTGHAFQDMAVVPGSFYVETALYLERELYDRPTRRLDRARFHRPLILTAEETLVRVEIRELPDGVTEYGFGEATASAGVGDCVTLAAEEGGAPLRSTSATDSDAAIVRAFPARAEGEITGADLYDRLAANGNQYGDGYRRVGALWRKGDAALASISIDDHARAGPFPRHPGVIDSMAQVLASLAVEGGRTFVLRSIGSVAISDEGLPATLWAHATGAWSDDGAGFTGTARLIDEAGKLHAELRDVELAFLETSPVTRPPSAIRDRRTSSEPEDARGTLRIAVASNFTADPVEPALAFWGEHFGVPVRVDGTPYNQIFQQLLDPASALAANRSGVNVLMIRPEEWIPAIGTGLRRPRPRALAEALGDRPRRSLPNGLEVAHLNDYETDDLYREIFDDECYLRHGIELPEGATVLDIGANIGLFSLFVADRCPGARIFAFEPAPVVHDLLAANLAAYVPGGVAVSAGVSGASGEASFGFYESSSVFSSFHPDEAQDRRAIEAVVRNALRDGAEADGGSVDGFVDELVAARLERTTHTCRVTTISEIVRDHGIDTIDLLKIDAEKSETAILDGIEAADWKRIRQIVMEIHDPSGGNAMDRILAHLSARGFRCRVDAEARLDGSGLYNLYAIREGAAGTNGAGRAMNGTAAPSNGAVRPSNAAARPSNGISDGTRLPPKARRADGLGRTVSDFVAALSSFMERSAVPLVLCICPETPDEERDAALRVALRKAEWTLIGEAGRTPNVHVIPSHRALGGYAIDRIHDPEGHAIGHVPYTPEAFAAMGTAVFRTIARLRGWPYKVVVLDCDNTLWSGVCGEDGPLGVAVTAPHRELQERMVDQMHAGMLLCLASKNNEADVMAVFEQRPDMILQRDHLVAWRIDWTSKSEGIRSLARELDLGLDSFILIDDNPVECAEVERGCPGVLTVRLPGGGDSFGRVLDHVWALDRAGSTAEDESRTRLYRENAERRRSRERAPSLKQFIEALELRTEVYEPADGDLVRVSQLTFRTNQFNLTTVRRSERELRDLLAGGTMRCLAVRVADRFGDYGLVGAVLYESLPDRYRVDTMLLSCRVLGKGVEHRVLARLARLAADDGRSLVELPYRASRRNEPARAFLESLGTFRVGDEPEVAGSTSEAPLPDAERWIFPSGALADLEYDPPSASVPEAGASTDADDGRSDSELFGARDRAAALRAIPEELGAIEALMAAIEATSSERAGEDETAGGAPDATDVEVALLDIWKSVLGRPRIARHDNFFDVGGTSLRAVQVVGRIRREMHSDLSLVSLFEHPTISALAAEIEGRSGGDAKRESKESAVRRGARRKVVRRDRIPRT